MTPRATKPAVFRASFAVYRAYLSRWDGHGGAIVIWIVPVVVALTFVEALFSHSSLWWPLAETGIFVVAGLYLLLMFTVSRVIVSPGRLERRNALGITRVYDAASLGRVVRLSDYRIPMYPLTSGSISMSFERMVVLDSRGKPALSWLGANWSDRQMTRLQARLGIPVDDIHGMIDARALRKRYPHAVPWAIAHWLLAAIIISGAIIVLGGAAIAIDISITGG